MKTFIPLFVLLICCASGPPVLPCITAPPGHMLSQNDNTIAASLTTDLQKLGVKAGADLKAEFQSKVDADFDKLSDANVSLFLFLQAIDCYMKNGKIGESIAKDMVAIVRARWGARQGLAGAPQPQLTPVE